MKRIALIVSFLFTCTVSAFAPQAVNRSLAQFRQRNDIPGLAAAVYIDGETYFFNFGSVTKNTLFEIASITKSFTATLLALAVVEGRMKLNDRVGMYLPFVCDTQESRPICDITLEQLATHTSSLSRQAAMKRAQVTQQRVLNSLKHWHPEWPMGTRFLYSNLGYEILGYALENAYDMPYGRILAEKITRPLEMDHTFLRVPPALLPAYTQGINKKGRPAPHNRTHAFIASGGLKSSTADLIKFLTANIEAHSATKLQQAMKLAQKGRFQANPRMVQALSWQNVTRDGITMIDKNGGLGGFSSWMGWVSKERSPNKKDVGLIILSNRRNPKVTKFGRRLLLRLAHME